LLSPMIAAAAMALSSLSVVGNANRLRRYRPEGLPSEGATLDRVNVEIHEHGQRKEKDMATVKDPVCGMDIDPATAAASEEHDGTTYYFCSEACHQKFVASPDQFAS